MVDSADRITTVTIDLDDTLVEYQRSPGEVLQAAFAALDLRPLFSVEEYYDRYREFAEQYDSMDDLRSECFAALAEEHGYDRDLGQEVASAFSEERDQSNVKLLPSTELLDALSSDYQLAVVTNGAKDAQRQKIAAVDLERWVETIVIAGHDLPPKPDPAPIQRALKSLDAAEETTVHIGDSLEMDVAGAAAAGVDSVWIADGTEPHGFKPTYTVPSVDDLSPFPWRDSLRDTR